MGEISNALQGMKTLFLSVDPTPQTALVDAWVFQDEQSSVTFDTFPVALVLRVINQQEIWRRISNDLSQHDWGIEVLLLLKAGAVLNDAMGAEMEAMTDPWLRVITAGLYNNPTLYGNVVSVGELGTNILFRPTISQIDWLSKTFWGIRFLFSVSQSVSH